MNVLITGVSKGIGAAMLQQLLLCSQVNKVFACTSTSISNEDFSGKLVCYKLDFTDDKSINELAKQITEPIHLLINNAGFLIFKKFDQVSITDLKKIYDINFFGPYLLIQKLLPNLKSGSAHIINIGSMGGYQGSTKFNGLSAYSSSKAALANLSECLAQELKGYNIKVNCLALGAVDTEMLEKAFPDYHSGVTPEEISKLILDFSFNWGRHVSGKIIPISSNTP